MTKKTNIVIHGAAGRMGRRLVALIADDSAANLAAALDAEACPFLGQDAGELAGVGTLGVPIRVGLPDDQPSDVVIDFSLPEGADAIVAECLAKKVPLVLATTALTEAQQAAVHAAAKEIPILHAPNMSLAVNLAMELTGVAAKALAGADSDVEILERHHRFKEDSPSGTALKFGEIVAEQMGQTKEQHGREGRIGERSRDEIGYHAIRTGDNPGEHTIVFGMLGETIEITVRASNRDCYASGAIAAAKYLVGKTPGLYSMKDMMNG